MATITAGVTSTAFNFSPATWKGDTGRGGSVYRQSFWSGAYFDFTFNASSNPTASILLASNANSLPITYFVNGKMSDNVSTASTGSLAINNLVASTVNTVRVYIRFASQGNPRWNSSYNLQVQGASIDSASSFGVAPAPTKWAIIGGDSITEGNNVDGTSLAGNFIHSSSYYLVENLNAQGYGVSMQAANGTGFNISGDGGVPGVYYTSGGTYDDTKSRWNKIDSGVSTLDSAGQLSSFGATGTPPSLIFWSFGGNDAVQGVSNTDIRNCIKGLYSAYAVAAPGAKLLFVQEAALNNAPTALSFLAALAAGLNDAQTAYPATTMKMVDFGSNAGVSVYGNSVNLADSFHPNTLGNLYLTARYMSSIQSILAPAASIIPFRGTFSS